jgi:hypothetical protein
VDEKVERLFESYKVMDEYTYKQSQGNNTANKRVNENTKKYFPEEDSDDD